MPIGGPVPVPIDILPQTGECFLGRFVGGVLRDKVAPKGGVQDCPLKAFEQCKDAPRVVFGRMGLGVRGPDACKNPSALLRLGQRERYFL